MSDDTALGAEAPALEHVPELPAEGGPVADQIAATDDQSVRPEESNSQQGRAPKSDPEVPLSQPDGSVGERTEQKAALDAEDVIRPNSLLIDERVGEELFGALYTGVTTRGPSMLGNHNNMIVNNLGGPAGKPFIGHLSYAAELLEIYAGSDADAALDELLLRRPTVCLTGPRNSGRFSTACWALASRHQPDQVFEICLPTGVPAEALVEQKDDVLENCGYLLRLPGKEHLDAMRKLTHVFRERSASLVLIKDEEPREREQHGAEVRHSLPDPIAVFHKHLTRRLSRNHGLSKPEAVQAVAAYLKHPELRAELNQVYGPKESVAIAQLISDHHPVDEDGMTAILAQAQPRRRQRARMILLPPHDGESARRRRGEQHERAFRVAYAAFRLRPLHYVFEAASWLLEEIDDAAMRPEWGRMALQHAVQDLLGEELKADWIESRDGENAALGASRVAWIRDGGMRGAILDVAWHDFDGTRKSLLKWLDRLVRRGDDVMRRAAAETTALLVHHDFDRVHIELIDDWANSPSPRVRQAAAWSEAVADLTGDVGHLIREKLREWCFGTNFQRDSAARLYASGLQQPVLALSMNDLRRIAEDRIQRRSYAVAEGVNQLYRSERARWLITELAGWTTSPRVRLHAARALLALASRSASDIGDGRPELLARLAEREVSVTDLAAVWQVALVEPEVSASAWPALSGWLRQADADIVLRKHAADLLRAVAARRAMSRRIEFFLQRTQDFESGLPSWIRREVGQG
jgi:hypothetical protein